MPTTRILGTNVRASSSGGMSPLGRILWHAFWIAISLVCLALGVNNYFQVRAFLARFPTPDDYLDLERATRVRRVHEVVSDVHAGLGGEGGSEAEK